MKLGPSHDGKLALLPPDSSENASFEGFLARFDDNGSLKWAQTSGITGDDFTVALATDGEGRAILMGNRIIGGGFGPYLSTVNLGGNPEKNAVLMDRNLTNTPVISWDPPKTLAVWRACGWYLFECPFEHSP